jgi:hypothetical protein
MGRWTPALLLALCMGCPTKDSPSSSPKAEDDEGSSKKKKKKAKKSSDDDDEPTQEEPTVKAAESFFAGAMPGSVKLRGTKEWAIEPNVLLFEPVEGYRGGRLPGHNYMAMSPDQSVVFRVMTSSAVVKELACKDLAATIAMAPARGKNVRELEPSKLLAVGKNGFAAREGACEADGPKGPLEVRYIDILRLDHEGGWHYAALVSLPKDAAGATRDEAMAWARSVTFNGRNGYTLP